MGAAGEYINKSNNINKLFDFEQLGIFGPPFAVLWTQICEGVSLRRLCEGINTKVHPLRGFVFLNVRRGDPLSHFSSDNFERAPLRTFYYVEFAKGVIPYQVLLNIICDG